METKLKVGDSFEVVETLTGGGFIDAFVPNRTTLKYKGEFICNHEFYREDFEKYSMLKPMNRLYISDNEVKPIGKLIITKVK